MTALELTNHATQNPLIVDMNTTASGWMFRIHGQTITVSMDEVMVTGTGQGVWVVNGQRLPYAVAQTETHVYCWLAGQVATFIKPKKRQRQSRGVGAAVGGDGAVKANMPGKVLQVLVAEGGHVSVGDAVVIVESMKMEMTLNASVSGRVKAVHVIPDAMVEIGQVLVDIEPVAED